MNTPITHWLINRMHWFLLLVIGLTAWLVTGCNQLAKEETLATKVLTVTDTIPPIDSQKLAYITGHFDPVQHPDFIEIPGKYASRAGMYLRRETLEAFVRMYEHAQQDGITLRIISATRNFKTQKEIWEAKWTGVRLVEDGRNLAQTTPDPVERALVILRYSSMPGTSRHHWGSDMDLNNLTNEFFATGDGLKMYNWLQDHGSEYGFCQPYTAQDSLRPTGYQEEKWHWSYLPIAQPLTQQAQYHLSDAMINGFLGAETADSIQVVRNYVLGINPQCKVLPE